ncbi:MAG: hypothetical protein CMI53_01710, partial [Parcubacteria group bacterium]|nr:hypothetical protein [Parcubacteria group bacterium]
MKKNKLGKKEWIILSVAVLALLVFVILIFSKGAFVGKATATGLPLDKLLAYYDFDLVADNKAPEYMNQLDTTLYNYQILGESINKKSVKFPDTDGYGEIYDPAKKLDPTGNNFAISVWVKLEGLALPQFIYDARGVKTNAAGALVGDETKGFSMVKMANGKIRLVIGDGTITKTLESTVS